MQLKNQVIVITGTTSGIGKALASELEKQGAIVIKVARHEKEHKCDICKADEVRKLIKKAIEKHKKIDALINCAGVVTWNAVENEAYENYYKNMEVNFYGTLHICKEVLPYMLRQKSGKIINFSSGKGKKGGKNSSAYAASKFAVTGFSQCLREEVMEKGIQVFTICPGKVDTPIHDNDKNAPGKEAMLKTEDINDLVIYLLKTSGRVKLEDIEIRSNALG